MNMDLFRARSAPASDRRRRARAGRRRAGRRRRMARRSAHPEACATGDDHTGHTHEDDEICFTQEQIDAMDDSDAELGVDEIAKSRNVRHLANLPKQAEFAAENAFGSDLAFTGHYAITGNYNGFSIYDIALPAAGPGSSPRPSAPGSQNDVSVSGEPALHLDRLLAQQGRVRRQRRAVVDASRSRGRASGSSTSPTRPTRGTSAPSRPTAARTPTRRSRTGAEPHDHLRQLVLGRPARRPTASRHTTRSR